MLSRPTTWPDYTACKHTDPQFNVRFAPERRAQIDALADTLNISGAMLVRLVIIAIVDGENVSAERLIKIAGADSISIPVTP